MGVIITSLAAHEDYVPLNTTITFSPNESRKMLMVNTNNDSIIEDSEIFVLKIVSNSKQVSVHNTEGIRITIKDGKLIIYAL